MHSSSKEYWEQRLKGNFNFSGVGYQGIGVGYNYWLYKLRKFSFEHAIRFLKISLSKNKILEIGPGTGFYTQIFFEKGACSYTGIDITEVSVSQLRQLYPSFDFISGIAGEYSFLKGRDASDLFDLIVAMDVFFHIIDDNEYDRTLQNVANHLKPNGYFIFSETFSRNDHERGHIKDRTAATILKNLHLRGFEVVRIFPMFVLMNRPLGSSNKWTLYFSALRIKILQSVENTRINFLGFIIGMILFPIDFVLIRILSRTSCTSLIIAKRQLPAEN